MRNEKKEEKKEEEDEKELTPEHQVTEEVMPVHAPSHLDSDTDVLESTMDFNSSTSETSVSSGSFWRLDSITHFDQRNMNTNTNVQTPKSTGLYVSSILVHVSIRIYTYVF